MGECESARRQWIRDGWASSRERMERWRDGTDDPDVDRRGGDFGAASRRKTSSKVVAGL